MKQQITGLMLKHGMAVYDVNYAGVAACVNEMLGVAADRLDEKARHATDIQVKKTLEYAARRVRCEKIDPRG